MNSLCVVVCALIGLSQACELPPPSDIDWSKLMEHPWYEVLSAGTPIDQLHYCDVRVHEKIIPEGVLSSESSTNNNGEVEHFKALVMKTPDGYYVQEFDLGTPKDLFKHLTTDTKTAKKQGKGAISGKLAIYTDYKNYILVLDCDASGRNDVWYYGPNRNPSAGDILRVTNKLGEIGGGWSEVQLYLDKCVTRK